MAETMCEDCKKKRWPATARPASRCGHGATRGGMAWCADCASRRGVCPGCGRHLPDAEPPPGSRHPRR